MPPPTQEKASDSGVNAARARYDLLGRATAGMVRSEPFPHLVIEDALDEEVYAELEATFPREELVRAAMHVPNRDQLQAMDALEHPEIAAPWKEFIRHHISARFFQDLAALFAPYVQQLYPWLEAVKGRPLSKFSVGVRDPKAAALPDVCLDCQPGLNTVTLGPATPRTAHLDAPNKLFTGLFYMRLPGDDAAGGDLRLHRLNTDASSFDSPTTIPEAQLETVTTVRYRRNTVVFFMNSPVSLHSVSVRAGTPVPRRLVNLVAGLYTIGKNGLFPTPPPASLMKKVRFQAPQ